MAQSDQISLQSMKVTSTSMTISEETRNGLLIALMIIGLWASSLIFLFSLDLCQSHILGILVGVALQTFLYTGLFITAHDAMHGVVFPLNLKINNLIGSLSLFLYGLFFYKELLKKHWLHHHHPASELDPDFHNNKYKNFFAWYFYFMKRYWSWTRLIGLVVVFKFVHYALHIPENNLTLFWVIPSLLSSLQLFYFGTFLPHREPKEGYTNSHRAKTYPLPFFWSFITCYHFGYHQEHHEYPHIPWWRLPEIYRSVLRQALK